MDREVKKRIAHEVLIVLGVMLLLAFITKLWPIIILIILVILVCVLRLIFLSVKTVEVIVPGPPVPVTPPPETEQSLTQKAFGLLQRRITDTLAMQFPNARWIWSTQNSIVYFRNNDPLIIFLKNAGGYRKAIVRTRNLMFLGLEYETVKPQQETAQTPESESAEPEAYDRDEDDEQPVALSTNYGLIAYEWVTAHLISINERYNEVIAQKREELLIPSEELPHPDSWFDICKELKRNGFAEAVILEDGIQVNLPQ